MKKFLTVLLVIAVMFTFSFGTALAGINKATTAEATKLAEAKAYAESLVTANYDTAYKAVVQKTLKYEPTSTTKKAIWDAIDAKAALQSFINDQYVKAANNFDSDWSGYNTKQLAAAVFTAGGFVLSETKTDNTAVVVSDQLTGIIFNQCEKAVNVAAFNADREDVLSAFDKVDYSVYSDTAVEKASGKTYLTLAKEKVAEGKDLASKKAIFDAETIPYENLVYLNGSMATFKAFVDSYLVEKKIDVNGEKVGLGIYTVNDPTIKTISQLENEGITDAATVAQTKATIQKIYADYITDNAITPDKDYANAYVTVYNFFAEEGLVNSASLASHEAVGLKGLGLATALKNAVSDIEDLTAFAAKYKAEKDATGALVRDAAEVDKIVKQATKDRYLQAVSSSHVPTLTVDDAKTKIIKLTKGSFEAELEFAKEVAKKALADAKKAVIDDYYPLEAEKIEARYAKKLADVEAATSVDKVKSLVISKNSAKSELISGINTKAVVNGKVSFASGAPKAAKEAVNAYINYANSGKTALNSEYIVAKEAAIEKAIAKVYGEAGARKASEYSATKIDVATIVAELPTVGALDAAKKAADEAIKALPTKPVAADKDAVIEAWKLAGDYDDLTSKAVSAPALDNAATLTNAITKLFADMQYDFAKKISAVDKNDKAALRELQAELDDANDLIAEDEIFEGKAPAFDKNEVVANAIDDIRTAELKTVIAAINAIPVNVTEADKATVAAARAAYDAFVKDWTEYSAYNDYDAAAQITNFRTLALAEATLGLNNDPEENAKAYVQDLKIAARSVKTSKGVKVTINADVQPLLDDGFTVEYKFYRSTKSNKNFGKAMITKTEGTYTNTKGVKGTKYYYKAKLVVKNAAGEVVATTPLTQCLYATRTF